MIMLYIMSQETTMMATMVDCNEHARSCKQQTACFIDVDQPIDDHKGTKHQQ